MPEADRTTSRREILRRAVAAAGLVAGGPFFAACGSSSSARAVPTRVLSGLGDLEPPDAHGLRLPTGFSARIIARAGEPVTAGSSYVWHRDPDGGAVFASADGGWVYVSNSESVNRQGGVGAVAFDADGNPVSAYPLLQGTSRNCAGGPTPWGTWLSCEEMTDGRVHECDPTGSSPAVERPALGTFRHEAAAVDPRTGQVYLTEDQPDGRLYRYTPTRMLPDGRSDLDDGVLEVARVRGSDPHVPRAVTWMRLVQPNPDVAHPFVPTRYQVAGSTPFEGGEGIFHHDGRIFFTTKRDNRVWILDIAAQRLSLLYDGSGDEPVISQVDNVTVDTGGTAFVAEDGPGILRIAAFTPDGRAGAILEVLDQDGSELTGPAFDPSGERLYFSSQRGPGAGGKPWGITYEVRGPFAGL